jgi:hypothetical protein
MISSDLFTVMDSQKVSATVTTVKAGNQTKETGIPASSGSQKQAISDF